MQGTEYYYCYYNYRVAGKLRVPQTIISPREKSPSKNWVEIKFSIQFNLNVSS